MGKHNGENVFMYHCAASLNHRIMTSSISETVALYSNSLEKGKNEIHLISAGAFVNGLFIQLRWNERQFPMMEKWNIPN